MKRSVWIVVGILALVAISGTMIQPAKATTATGDCAVTALDWDLAGGYNHLTLFVNWEISDTSSPATTGLRIKISMDNIIIADNIDATKGNYSYTDIQSLPAFSSGIPAGMHTVRVEFSNLTEPAGSSINNYKELQKDVSSDWLATILNAYGSLDYYLNSLVQSSKVDLLSGIPITPILIIIIVLVIIYLFYRRRKKKKMQQAPRRVYQPYEFQPPPANPPQQYY